VPNADGYVSGTLPNRNSLVCCSTLHANPFLLVLLQITMTYAYWKAGRHNEHAVFDMFFRKKPFEGEFTIFAGLDETIKFIQTFKFTSEHVEFLKSVMPRCEDGFWGTTVLHGAYLHPLVPMV
jgi:hypothetical protein